ncbi:MAG: GDP-mannose 4,6-dehydratase, partial [Candidatus Diapherotrites archaeon]
MQKILVTGGAGFIGSNFVEMFSDRYEITVLDKLTYAGRMENLEQVKGKIKFEKGDICDKKTVEPLMKQTDAVINFAAESHVDRSILEPESFVKTDVLGAFVLLDCAKERGIEKFVQISTDEVYGSVESGKSKETDELKPSSPYSASKAGADRLAYSYYYTFGLPVCITRASNNYGKRHFPEKLIPLCITNLIQGKKVPVYGDGLNKRDWLFAEDN